MIKNLKKKKAFTLVEVIIVLAIIAIIAAIAIPNLTKVRTESKKKADVQSLETIERTINMLVTDETIAYNAGEIVLAYDTTTKALQSVKIGSATAVTSGDVFDYFKTTRAPQTEGKSGYKVTVTNGVLTSTLTP